MRIISFSADGLQQAASEGLYSWLEEQHADFICIQDMRCAEYDLQEDRFFPGGYNAYFCDDVGGKANGVAIYCRELPKAIMTGIGLSEFDMEGRYIQADYQNISVGCLLAPDAAAGDGPALARKSQFFEFFGNHLQKVRNKRREFILCGNWQIAPSAADVQDTESASGVPGFLSEERQWMDDLLSNGYVDAFRQINTDRDEFSWWPDGNRQSNGWRTDLQVVSETLKNKIEHGALYKVKSFSSHAPLIMDYDLDV